jgi:hypothetical protein
LVHGVEITESESGTEMNPETAANIAWCLMGAVMVGAALMYGFMYRFVSEAYEDGRQDTLRLRTTDRTRPASS